LTVAFQGEPGAYSEAAALEHFGAGIQTVPCESFDDMFSAVENDIVDYAMAPIENSLAGSIHHNYDLLIQRKLWINGEHYLRVHHCLIATPGVQAADLRTVISHPQALAQCNGYLHGHGLTPKVFYDTAGAVKHLRSLLDHPGEASAEAADQPIELASTAAIASRRAAEVYGLPILEEGIEDNPANFTRFLVLSRQAIAAQAMPESPSGYKTTLVFALKNEPGSLFKALSVFALRNIDLTKIESRPLVGRPWEYLFYVDFLGATGDPSVQRAINHLEEYATSLRVFGSYPRHVV
jgi:prephenate dehydratase